MEVSSCWNGVVHVSVVWAAALVQRMRTTRETMALRSFIMASLADHDRAGLVGVVRAVVSVRAGGVETDEGRGVLRLDLRRPIGADRRVAVNLMPSEFVLVEPEHRVSNLSCWMLGRETDRFGWILALNGRSHGRAFLTHLPRA